MSIESSIVHLTHEGLEDIRGGINAVLSKLGLEHGIPEDKIAEAKVAVSAILPTIEAVAAPIAEREIAAEAPALAPVAEQIVQTGEAAAASALAP